MNDERATIRSWMRRVMQERDWKAADWARAADTSATNITRFMNGTAEHVPSSRTIATLAKAAGYGPDYLDLGSRKLTQTRMVPLLNNLVDIKNYLTGDLDLSSLETFTIAVGLGNNYKNMFALTITENSFDADGIFAGDEVICVPESEQPLENGSKVVALIEGEKAGVYAYHPPYLTTQSTTGQGPIKLTTAEILGVAVKVQRDL